MSKKFSPYLIGSFLFIFPLMGFAEDDIEPSNLLQIESQSSSETLKSFEPFTGKVSASKVRMRTSPNLEGFVVRETSPGELFAVTGIENDFYVVKAPKGSKGYVFRTYILDGVVEAERVNIRLSPETEAPIIGRLNSGDKVNAILCAANNKWFEIELPETSHFYIAKEYIENIGAIEVLAKKEEKHAEGMHLLNSAILYGRSEIQKPFEEIDFDNIHRRLSHISNHFNEFSDLADKAAEANHLFEETYMQKKIAFLEYRAEKNMASRDEIASLKKFAKPDQSSESETSSPIATVGQKTTSTLGLATSEAGFSDKMLIWQPLEESIYHLWASTHEGSSLEDFYKEEAEKATILSGIVEPYNRPVKNRPGDFLLRSDNIPVAFLYSTKINLNEVVGKKITVIGLSRPNNHFAFPAYFVLSAQ